MLFFGTLELLMSFLCPSWRFLSRFNPKLTPKIHPTRDPKSKKNDPKIGPHFYSIFTDFKALGSILGLKIQLTKKPGTQKVSFS